VTTLLADAWTRPDTRLPMGFAVRLASGTKVADGGTTLFGSTTGRLLYLSPSAVDALDGDLLRVVDETSETLARTLLDRDMAHPTWDGTRPDDDPDDLALVTVVVPVRDRPQQLRRLLAELSTMLRVVVVDDGSTDQTTVARVALESDAMLVRHPVSRGPAAARNAGLAATHTPFVAFVDSDVVPEPGWVTALLRHFDDPTVGIAAPRVLGTEAGDGGSWLHRYEAVRSSLDLGPSPALVRPHGRVAYVPSAALMVRRAAWTAGFDESMRVAEDVDLVWRTVADGWRVRYEPQAVVRHEHRTDVRNWLGRKAFYGTGAALLAERHGDAVAPMVLTPWTAALAGTLLTQRWWSVPVGVAVYAGTTVNVSRRLRRSRRPLVTAASMTVVGAVATGYQTASALTRHYWPVAAVAAVVSPRARRALLLAAVVDGVLDYRRTRPALDPVRYIAARRLDDLAYGAGVWYGALRARSPRALLPSWQGVDVLRTSTRRI